MPSEKRTSIVGAPFLTPARRLPVNRKAAPEDRREREPEEDPGNKRRHFGRDFLKHPT